MIGLTLPQPAASSVVYGVEAGAVWPSGWPMRPDAVGQYVAIHAGVAWSPAHATRAAQLGVDDCPRGQVVGVARVSGWARVAHDGPRWLGDPERRPAALVDAWPLGSASTAVFFDDAVALTRRALGGEGDDAELVCFGNQFEPWTVGRETQAALRRRWAGEAAPSMTAVVPTGGGPGPRCSKPATDDALANADVLAGLLPEGWSTRLDGFTCAIVGPDGRCRRALVRAVGRADLRGIVTRLVHA